MKKTPQDIQIEKRREAKRSLDDFAQMCIESDRKVIQWNPNIGKQIIEANKNQKLLILRHGERVDYAFPRWSNHAFDNNGGYHRLDLNMPKILPKRADEQYIVPWKFDPPITQIGKIQAYLIGEMLKEQGIQRIEFVYSSPAYRCIMTAKALLKGIGIQNDVKIRIEPGLFEWCAHAYYTQVPQFMTLEELEAANFNIDTSYVPLVTLHDLEYKHKGETIEDFYNRNHMVTEHVTKLTSQHILLVGHAANLETNSRMLLGSKPLNINDIKELMTHIPYASLLTLEKNDDSNWYIPKPFVLPITHSRNFNFDWRRFQEQHSSTKK